MGLWDRLTGTRKRTLTQYEKEAQISANRDKTQRETLTAIQLVERRKTFHERAKQRETNKSTTRDLTANAKVFRNMEIDAEKEREAQKEAFKERRRTPTNERKHRRSRSRDGPDYSL